MLERHRLARTVRWRTVANESMTLVAGMTITVPAHPAGTALVLAYGVTIRYEGHREHVSGQADLHDEPRARVVSWPPLRPTRLRRERGSVVVVLPTAPATLRGEEQAMRRVIGMDIRGGRLCLDRFSRLISGTSAGCRRGVPFSGWARREGVARPE